MLFLWGGGGLGILVENLLKYDIRNKLKVSKNIFYLLEKIKNNSLNIPIFISKIGDLNEWKYMIRMR